MVQHANIPDSQLHEPKGIVNAQVGTVYQSNGVGSGTWGRLPSTSLRGIAGDGTISNLRVVTDGANGFKLLRDIAYVQMGLDGNTNAFTIGAATDPKLNTLSDYVQLQGTGAPWGGGLGRDAGFLGNQINVGVTGVYRLALVATVTSFPSDTAKVAFKLRINNSTPLPRKAIAHSAITNATVQAMSVELAYLTVSDTVQVYIASTVAGGVVVSDLSLVAELVEAANG